MKYQTLIFNKVGIPMKLAQFYSVVGNETTYRVSLLLANYALSVQEITDALQLGQSHVSHKLARLKEFDYVSFHRQGKRTFYRLNEPWRSLLISGDTMWRRLSPESRHVGVKDFENLHRLFGSEINNRLIYPLVGESPFAIQENALVIRTNGHITAEKVKTPR